MARSDRHTDGVMTATADDRGTDMTWSGTPTLEVRRWQQRDRGPAKAARVLGVH